MKHHILASSRLSRSPSPHGIFQAARNCMEGKLSQRWLSRRKCRGHRVGWWRDAQGGVGKLADQKGSMHYPKAAEDRNATDCLFFKKSLRRLIRQALNCLRTKFWLSAACPGSESPNPAKHWNNHPSSAANNEVGSEH